jgi:hypothetical protein
MMGFVGGWEASAGALPPNPRQGPSPWTSTPRKPGVKSEGGQKIAATTALAPLALNPPLKGLASRDLPWRGSRGQRPLALPSPRPESPSP